MIDLEDVQDSWVVYDIYYEYHSIQLSYRDYYPAFLYDMPLTLGIL